MVALLLRTATAHHTPLQPEKLRDALDGVYEDVGRTRNQSEAAREDSRGVFIDPTLRPSIVKNSQTRKIR